MPQLLVRFTAAPVDARVVLADPSASALPEWESGREPVTAQRDAMAVATRAAQEGDVEIEVWRGEAHFRVGTVVFDGPFVLGGSEASVGSAGDVRTVDLGAGEHRVRVFVDRPGRAAQVAFAVS
jgi:hypothetical protein